MAELLIGLHHFARLVDGCPGWWGPDGPEYLAWLGEQREADYTVLMGANTYRDMSGYAAEGEPGTDALAGLSKVVLSTTSSEPLSRVSYSIRIPEIARAMTSCWICSVPSKMS